MRSHCHGSVTAGMSVYESARSPARGLQWQGWIKDYDSVTLMECRIDPLLPHTRLPDLFARQRAALQLRIAAHSHSQVVRPGLPAGSQPVEVADIPGAGPPAPCGGQVDTGRAVPLGRILVEVWQSGARTLLTSEDPVPWAAPAQDLCAGQPMRCNGPAACCRA